MYEIHCQVSGDRAEAEDLDGALLAADTLARDFGRSAFGALAAARRSMTIYLGGKRDPVATALARQGQRRSPSAEWSQS